MPTQPAQMADRMSAAHGAELTHPTRSGLRPALREDLKGVVRDDWVLTAWGAETTMFRPTHTLPWSLEFRLAVAVADAASALMEYSQITSPRPFRETSLHAKGA